MTTGVKFKTSMAQNGSRTASEWSRLTLTLGNLRAVVMPDSYVWPQCWWMATTP